MKTLQAWAAVCVVAMVGGLAAAELQTQSGEAFWMAKAGNSPAPQNSQGSGTFNLTGGTVAPSSYSLHGSGTFNLTGGTLISPSCWTNIELSPQATLAGSGTAAPADESSTDDGSLMIAIGCSDSAAYASGDVTLGGSLTVICADSFGYLALTPYYGATWTLDVSDGNFVGISDYIALTANYGWTNNSGTDGIPEPATIAMLGLGGLAMLRRRRA